MRKRLLPQVIAAVMLTATVLAGGKKAKTHQTGKFIDLKSEEYNKLINNATTRAPLTVRRRANSLSIQIGDLIVVGECVAMEHVIIGRNPCQPENWIVGDPIEVRIKGNAMYLKEPDGKKELKTKIVERRRAQANGNSGAANSKTAQQGGSSR